MSSNYSDRLKLEIMSTGANANTWGTNTNNNLDVIDAFMSGYLSKSVAGSSNITLTTANASDTAESSNRTIELTGALTGDIVVFIPAVESKYSFFNNTTGSQTLTIAATGHTANGIAIAQSAKTTVFCDGASNYNVEILSSTDAGDLASGTVPDARFPATLPQVSGANLTDLAAGNVATGTLASDRLPTVPTTKGGTGLTSLGSAGQIIQVNAPGAALEYADAGGGTIGNVTTATQLTSSGNITTRADTLFAIGIAVGGGGSGGCGGHGFGQGQGQPGATTTGLGMTGAGGSQGAAGYPNPGANGGSGGAGGGMLGGAPGGTGTPGKSGVGGAGGTNPFGLGSGGQGSPGSGENGGGGGAGGAFSDITGPFTRGATISVTVGAGGIGRPGNRGTGQSGGAGMFRYAEYYT